MNIKNTKTVLAGAALMVLLAGCGAEKQNSSGVIPFSTEDYLDVVFVSEGMPSYFAGDAFHYLTKEGAPLTPDAYDIAYPFHEGLACVCKDGKYGFIDMEGVTAIPFDFDDASPFVEGLAYFVKGDRYGFMDKKGTPLFYLDCDSVSAFQEGLAYIFADGKYGYIDKTGNMAIAPAFDDAGYFHNGAAIVMQDCKYGVIDQNGHFLIPATYEKISASDNVFIAEKNKEYAIFDNAGNAILDDSYGAVQNVSEAYALPYTYAGDDYIQFDCAKDAIHGFTDGSRTILFHNADPAYAFIDLLPEKDLAIAKKGDFYGILNFEDEIVIPFSFSAITYEDDAENGVFLATDAGGKIHILDAVTLSERAVLNYDSIGQFTNGRATASLDGQTGIIDADGNLIMPLSQYDVVGLLENGSYWCQTDSSTSLYDKNGTLLHTGDYDYIRYYSNHYIILENSGNGGLPEFDGNALFLPGYKEYRYDVYGFINQTLFGNYLTKNYILVQTGEERESKRLSELFLTNHITPGTPVYANFLKDGAFPYISPMGDDETSFSELYAYEKTYKFLPLGENDTPLLYFKAEPYKFIGFPMSYSGFLTLQGEEIVCLLSGYECGGSSGGSYICLLYDTEQDAILPGKTVHYGGFGGHHTGREIYDYTSGNFSLRCTFSHTDDRSSNYLEETLLQNAALFYDSDDKPYTKDTILDAGSVNVYSVDGELTTIEHYQEVDDRYKLLFPL